MTKHFGIYFREMREKLELSQGDVAKMLDVERAFISQIESNESFPSFNKLLKILEVREFRRAFDIFLNEQLPEKRIKRVAVVIKPAVMGKETKLTDTSSTSYKKRKQTLSNDI